MNPEKHPEVARRVPRVQDGRIRGAALIIVLSFLIIITGLVVAFLSTVTDNATETSSAAAAKAAAAAAAAAAEAACGRSWRRRWTWAAWLPAQW